MDTAQDHWEKIYSHTPPEKMGWYEPHLRISLQWIKDLMLSADAPIIDIGGGACTLADDLLDAGYRALSVLDISEKALLSAKARLGPKTQTVTWLLGDIMTIDLSAEGYVVWHDRAMFHFLTEPAQQQKYLEQITKALKPNGHVIIGTFAPEAPPKCSGLPVRRYSPVELEATFGTTFELKRCQRELHITPGGIDQMYLYCHFMKIG